MKIAYLSNSFITSRAANSIQVMKMCQAFARNGHDVTLFAWHPKGEARVLCADVFAFYGVQNCFKLKRMPSLSFKGYGWASALLRGLIIKTGKFDIAYGRNLLDCYVAALLGKRVIYELHTPPNQGLFKSLVKSENLIQLVVISNALKQKICADYSLDPAKVMVAHDGADLLSLPLENSFRDQSLRLRAGYIGHMYPGKGVELIVKLARQCPWADFYLVGGEENDINYWKSLSKGVNNLFFEGFLPPGEGALEQKRALFDVLLAPYQRKVAVAGGKGDISRWMSPLKIFEYMASGRPIVSSDLPVLREVLEDGRNALLCPPDDIETWVQSLERLRDDPELSRRLARAALNDLRENYTWNRRAETVLKGVQYSHSPGISTTKTTKGHEKKT